MNPVSLALEFEFSTLIKQRTCIPTRSHFRDGHSEIYSRQVTWLSFYHEDQGKSGFELGSGWIEA